MTSIDPKFLKNTTNIAKPIAASAAATVKVNIAKICPEISFKKDEKAIKFIFTESKIFFI